MLALLEAARAADYRFVPVTPETHRRVLERRGRAPARDLRDVFGWSLPFDPDLLPPAMVDALRRSDLIRRDGDLFRSEVRIGSIGADLLLHSAYPTDRPDSVFLGPDSHRFAAFLGARIPELGPVRHLVDIGAGAGVGAIAAASLLPGARLTLTDVNPLALRFARANAAHAGFAVRTILCDGLSGVAEPADLIVANPPFIADPAGPAYRDGGDMRGARLSLDWAVESARRLDPGGTLLLYTGSAIVAGRDRFREALEDRLGDGPCRLDYAEIDPDIFGEQLAEPGYEEVERIAAVGVVIRRS